MKARLRTLAAAAAVWALVAACGPVHTEPDVGSCECPELRAAVGSLQLVPGAEISLLNSLFYPSQLTVDAHLAGVPGPIEQILATVAARASAAGFEPERFEGGASFGSGGVTVTVSSGTGQARVFVVVRDQAFQDDLGQIEPGRDESAAAQVRRIAEALAAAPPG